MHEALFSPVELGAIRLPSRIVMAPMTRSRAHPDGVPTAEMADYYAQRARAGLIITEGTQPNDHGQGYCRTPGLHTDMQEKAWRGIADGVVAAGGQMVMQLMHVGRISSHHNKLPGARTLAPSPLQARQKMYTDAAGMVDCDAPEEMDQADIEATITAYVNSAKRARAAGLEGVELHATSGYLPAQFLSTGTNRRSDGYGGSLKRRLRFCVEVLEAMSAAIGADRVGLRICPGNPFNDLQDEDPAETFAALLDATIPMQLAYLHAIRMPATGIDNFALAQTHFRGPLVFNDSFNADEAERFVSDGACAAIAFGRPFIANPDFPDRVRRGAPLADFNPKRLYTAGPAGYSDYPAMGTLERSS